MEKVTLFLQTSLFSVAGPDAHVPHGVTVVTGTVLERSPATLRVRTEKLSNERGRVLNEAVLVLELPWAKIDHLVVRSD